MKTTSIPACIILAGLPLFASAEVEYEIGTAFGYDTNPFQLSDNERDGFFTELEAGIRREIARQAGGELFIGLDADGRFYESNVDDANQFKVSAYLGYETAEFDTRIGTGVFEIEGEIMYRDSTFTDRVTGLEADSGGTPIGDRYDSWSYDLDLTYENEFTDRVSGELILETRYRDYTDDYGALGLDRLDYFQFAFRPRLEVELDDQWTFKTEARYRKRYYTDREARDLLGASIPGTDLEYDSLRFEAELEYELNDQWEFAVGGSYGTREDNEAGYSDKEEYKIGAEAKYEPSDRLQFKLSVDYIDREFDVDSFDASGVDGEPRAKEGWRIALDVDYELGDMLGSKTDSELFCEIDYETIDNASSTLSYDRLEVLIGIKADF